MPPTDTTNPAPSAPWPAGCPKPAGCERRRACGYARCPHARRDIAAEVDAAVRAELARPIGPDTVTVLGHIWKADAPWSGLDFSKAELLTTSMWGDDYHLRVPWCHPDDAARQEGHEDECFYRVRLRRKQSRFVQIDGGWMVEARNADPA